MQKHYKNYKDSGIEWLGEIPEHWNINHLKRLCKLIKDGTHSSFKRVDNDGYPLLSVRNIVNSQFVNLDDDSLISEEDYLSIIKSFKVIEGDIQLAIVGATMGKVAIVPKLLPFATQRSIATIRVNNRHLFNRYLYYFIQGVKFQNFLWENTNYSAQPGIYLGAIQATNIFIPPFSEQTQIANYLDIKSKIIDNKIDLLYKKAQHYKSFRESLINQIVTKGLNQNTSLKNSGIDWVGEIPSHWGTECIKNIFKERTSKNLNTTNNTPMTNNILSVMKDIGVINHRDKGNVGNKMAKDITKYKLVHPRDIVVNKMNIMIGSVGISYEFGALSVIYIILKANKEHHPEYFNYLFKSKRFQKSLRRIATGILEIREAVNMTLFKREQFPTPPINEQKEIAEYLDTKTATIDKIIKNIETQITTLKELRKTLINEVVTGKVKVTA